MALWINVPFNIHLFKIWEIHWYICYSLPIVHHEEEVGIHKGGHESFIIPRVADESGPPDKDMGDFFSSGSSKYRLKQDISIKPKSI